MFREHLHDGLVAVVMRSVVVARSELCRMPKRLAAPVHPCKLDSQVDLGIAWLEPVHLVCMVFCRSSRGIAFRAQPLVLHSATTTFDNFRVCVCAPGI